MKWHFIVLGIGRKRNMFQSSFHPALSVFFIYRYVCVCSNKHFGMISGELFAVRCLKRTKKNVQGSNEARIG